MKMSSTLPVEADILSRVIQPGEPTLAKSVARAWLRLGFDQSDKDRMRLLAEKARKGTLSAPEKAEAEGFERVGSWLGLLQSKARCSLKSNVESE